MSEYRRVIPLNDRIIEDINLEENENEEGHEKMNDQRFFYMISRWYNVMQNFFFSGTKSQTNLQSLLNSQRANSRARWSYYFDIITYDNLKLSMRWFLESASISFSFTVINHPICYTFLKHCFLVWRSDTFDDNICPLCKWYYGYDDR